MGRSNTRTCVSCQCVFVSKYWLLRSLVPNTRQHTCGLAFDIAGLTTFFSARTWRFETTTDSLDTWSGVEGGKERRNKCPAMPVRTVRMFGVLATLCCRYRVETLVYVSFFVRQSGSSRKKSRA